LSGGHGAPGLVQNFVLFGLILKDSTSRLSLGSGVLRYGRDINYVQGVTSNSCSACMLNSKLLLAACAIISLQLFFHGDASCFILCVSYSECLISSSLGFKSVVFGKSKSARFLGALLILKSERFCLLGARVFFSLLSS